MNITIKKSTLYWIFVFLIQLALIAYLNGLFDRGVIPGPDPGPVPTPVVRLVMNATEAKLVKEAIVLVKYDLKNDGFSSTDEVIDALSAEIPSSVKDKVLQVLGTPDFADLESALDALSEKIEVE